MTAEQEIKLDQLGKSVSDLSAELFELKTAKNNVSIQEKLDEVDHLLIVLRVVTRQPIPQELKKDLQVLVVKQINNVLNEN